MNDAEFEKQIARIKQFTNRWHLDLGLRHWDVKMGWCRSAQDLENPADTAAAAVCKPDWQYLQASVGWNLWNLVEASDQEVETIYVHEMMHILLSELEVPQKRHMHEERVATILAKAFIWVKQGEPIEGEY